MSDKTQLPYVNAYNGISDLFPKIKQATVPTKFTNDFLASILGLKSSSHRALIPLLKKLNFLDENGVPTSHYKNYRGEEGKSGILANQIRNAYSDLYKTNEYAHTLEKKDIENAVIRITGASSKDKKIQAISNTFSELVKLADFSGKPSVEIKPEHSSSNLEKEGNDSKPKTSKVLQSQNGIGLSYTINLNLPPTTEVEVFNAIFKSLKDNLLDN